MPSKGSSGGGVTIQPYYDGRLLTGLHYVAGEGLSAISIKLSHNHCKFTADPHSRRPLVTCHQGINARNSFWNLHKPDLKRVKGLECSTSESVAQLFRAHNVENAGKPTYKRRMLRLLESLVVKKSKTSIKTAEELVPNRRLVAHQCVLAPLVHETGERKIIDDTLGSHLYKPQRKILKISPSSGSTPYNTRQRAEASTGEAICPPEDNHSSDCARLAISEQGELKEKILLRHFGQNGNWVLGTRKMKARTVVSLHDFISQNGGGSDIYNEKLENTVNSVDTLFISQPQGANMLTNSSENTLIGIGFNKVMEPSNGDILSSDIFTPLKETSGLDTARALSISTVPSCLKLKNKQPLPHLSTVGSTKSQYCEFDQGHIGHQDLSGNVQDEHNQVATHNYGGSGFDEVDTTKVVGITDVINQGTSFFPTSLSIPSPPVIQTIVEEMLEIEDYISSYTSLLCVHEEELKSSEVVEHFFGEFRSTGKLKTENTESQSANQSEVGRTTTCQTTDLLTNNEKENELFTVDVSISTHELNLNEGNLDTILSYTYDSGIDLNMTEHDDGKKSAILDSSDTKSSVKLTNNNNSSINLIEFDEINIEKCEKTSSTKCMTPMMDETAKQTEEINDIFDIEFHTQSLALQSYALEDITVIESSSKEYKSESNNNNILETNILPDDTFGINSATNGYCYWEESDVAINTRLSTEIPTNDSITHSTPENMFSPTGSALVSCTFMEDVWRQYFEVVNQDPLFMHVDGSGLYNDGLFSNYGYWETLYDNIDSDTYVRAEDVVNIDNFIVNGCAHSGPIESHHYNDSCTIVEIEDDFSQTEVLGEEKCIARERPLIDSRCPDTINIKAARDNESKPVQNDEVFKVHNNESRYSESNGRHLRSFNYFLDNSGDIDIENGERNATPNRVTNAQKDNNLEELNYKDSLTEKSRLVQVPRNTAKLDSQNPQMIFTSPNIQLNLTKPAVNPNKK